MKDSFEGIRAERDDLPFQSTTTPNRHAGLWKQIALGIVVGYCALSLMSLVAWFVASRLMLANLNFAFP